MKRWVIILLAIVAVLFVIGFLYDQGFLRFEWQPLATLMAALAGPFLFLKNKLFDRSSQIMKDKENNYLQMKKEQDKLRMQYEVEIKVREQKIADLEKNIENMKKDYKEVKEERSNIKKEIQDLDIDETNKKLDEILAQG